MSQTTFLRMVNKFLVQPINQEKLMNKFLKAAALMVCAAVLSACATAEIHVDPRYHLASYESLRRLAAPMLVRVSVQFQQDGNPLPAEDGALRGNIERTLRASGVFRPTVNPIVPLELTVIANRITAPATARAKGFTTGSIGEGASPTIDNNYEFNFTYTSSKNRQPVQAAYLHAIHIAPTPAEVKATAMNSAFGQVVEDVVLNFIKDLQDKGQV